MGCRRWNPHWNWSKNGGQPSLNGIGRGGFGGYSVGVYLLNFKDKVYVYVGGRGNDESERTSGPINGGWNGGGSNRGYSTMNYNPTGGGATDISTVYSPVELDDSRRYSRTSESYLSRLIIAGGGGGGCLLSSGEKRNGGHGGGYKGNDGQNGLGSSIGIGGDYEKGGNSMAAGGSSGEFGLGSPYGHNYDGASGGGGYYGGGESRDSGAGGGSGFIGKVINYSDVISKMFCYQCSESIENHTYSTDIYSNSPLPSYAKSGDGYAIITILYAQNDTCLHSCLSIPSTTLIYLIIFIS